LLGQYTNVANGGGDSGEEMVRTRRETLGPYESEYVLLRKRNSVIPYCRSATLQPSPEYAKMDTMNYVETAARPGR
jgi:hypothetical protein